ncbi:hypothetical protein [Candidatus Albibeggiatoa sp. nov. BB20]|uniref:hypothetical protein n=1 Tax=Candidatus Albibeggiatoa sp. nov. BB20 TaxID=3162723 RepID=UPI0033657290
MASDFIGYGAGVGVINQSYQCDYEKFFTSGNFDIDKWQQCERLLASSEQALTILQAVFDESHPHVKIIMKVV